jgi:NAD(P)-dependent dehydrogenase (short-subunit alcohol dehydrogenase family)
MDLGLTNAASVGGGRGMRLAAARCLADDGAQVAVISRSRADLDRATEDLTAHGSPEAVALFAELGDRWHSERKVLINAVGPGAVGTVGVDGDSPYKLMDAIAKHFGHPAHLPRTGLPGEMGSVVAFLASCRNSYMTAARVNANGGSDFT